MLKSANSHGFSLIEIAIVLVIVSVLITIIAVPLATQVEQQRINETNKQLETIKEAIIGFALANGRFPCASRVSDNGVESVINPANGTCNQYAGLLPAVTLGLNPIDASGFAVDAWGLTANRIRYSVPDLFSTTTPTSPASCSSAGLHVLTRTGGMKAATMDCLADIGITMLTVCAVKPTGSPGAATSCTSTLTQKAPFVLVSLGKNAAAGSVGADESHNVDADSYFVSHTPASETAPSGEFDDIVVWPSLNTIFGRMVQAGKLP
jgi:prepilin-type N-terminal cleavage/methylation domain-containing protein